MGRSQPPPAPEWPQPDWSRFIGRCAVILGLSTALLSLLRDAPLGVACMRGGLVCLSTLALGRYGGRALQWSGPPPEADPLLEAPDSEPQA